jgi:hypothetical protein
MFSSSLPPVVCRSTHVLFTLFVFVCRSTHVLFMLFVFVCRSTHVLFTLFVFVCRSTHVLFTLFVFVCRTHVLFTLFVFVGGLVSYLRYLCLFVGVLMSYSRYLCLFVVSNTYCVLFLFCFSSTCVVSFSGLSILIAPFIFSDVYFQCALCFLWQNSWHHVSDCDFAGLHIFNWSEIVFHCFVLVQKQSLSQKMQCQLEMSLTD